MQFWYHRQPALSNSLNAHDSAPDRPITHVGPIWILDTVHVNLYCAKYGTTQAFRPPAARVACNSKDARHTNRWLEIACAVGSICNVVLECCAALSLG